MRVHSRSLEGRPAFASDTLTEVHAVDTLMNIIHLMRETLAPAADLARASANAELRSARRGNPAC